jgi:hypothetical protein
MPPSNPPPVELGVATISLFPQDKSISVEWSVTLPEDDTRIMTGGYLICCDREYDNYSVTDLSVCEAEEKCYEITTLNNAPLINGHKYTVQYVQLMNDGTQISSPSPMCKPVARPKPVILLGDPTIENQSSDGEKWDVRVAVDNHANAAYLGTESFISFKLCQIHEDYPPLNGPDDPNAEGGIDYSDDIVTRIMTVIDYGVHTEYVLKDIPKAHYQVMAVYSNSSGPSQVSNMKEVLVYANPANVSITAESGHDTELLFDVSCAIDNPFANIYKIVVSLTTMPDNAPVTGIAPIEMLASSGTIEYSSNAWKKTGSAISGKGKFTGLTNKQAYKVTAVGLTQGVNSSVAIGGDNDVMSSVTAGTATAVPAKFTLSIVEINSTSDGGITFTGYTITESTANTFITHRYSVSSNSPSPDPFSVSNMSALTKSVDDKNFFDGLIISVVMKDVIVGGSAYDNVTGGLASYWTSPSLETSGSEKLWVHTTAFTSETVDILPKVAVQTESGLDTELKFALSCNPVFTVNSVPDTTMVVYAALYDADDEQVGSTTELSYSAASGESGWTVENGNLRGRGSFSGLTNGSVYHIKVWATTVPPSPATTPSQSQFTKSYGVPCKVVQGITRFLYDNDGAPTGYSISDPTGSTLTNFLYDVKYYTDGTDNTSIVSGLAKTKTSAGSTTVDVQYLVTGAKVEATQFGEISSTISDRWEFPTLVSHNSKKYFEHPRLTPDKLSASLKRYDPPDSVYHLQVTKRTELIIKTLTWKVDFTIDNQPDAFEVKVIDTSDDSEIYKFTKNFDTGTTSGQTITFNQDISLTGAGPYTVSVTSMKYDREGNYLMRADPDTITVYERAALPDPDPFNVEQVDEWKQQIVLSAGAPVAEGYRDITPLAYVTITRNGSVLSNWNKKELDFGYQYAGGEWINSNVYELGGSGAPLLSGSSFGSINGWSVTTATWQSVVTNADNTRTATFTGGVLKSTGYNGPVIIKTTYNVDANNFPCEPIMFSLLNATSNAVVFTSSSTITSVNAAAKQIKGSVAAYPSTPRYGAGTWTNSNVYQLGGSGAPTLVGSSSDPADGWSFTTATWQSTVTNADNTKTTTYTGAVLTSKHFNGPVTITNSYGVDSQGLPNTPITFSLIIPSSGAVIFSSTSEITGVDVAAKQITGAVAAYITPRYAAGSWTNSNVYQLGGSGAPTLVGSSSGSFDGWSFTTATWQSTVTNADNTNTATYTGGVLTSNHFNGPVTVTTTYGVDSQGLPNTPITFSLIVPSSGAVIFSSTSAITGVNAVSKQITGSIAGSVQGPFDQILSETQYGDSVGVVFKTRALYSEYPSGSTHYVYSMGVQLDLAVTQLKYDVTGLEYSQGSGADIDLMTFSWDALTDVNSAAALEYSFVVTTNPGATQTVGAKVPLTSSDITTSNGKSSFSIRVKLGEPQNLTLSLKTTFDNLYAPSTSDSVDYTPTYDDLSITSHTWEQWSFQDENNASIKLSYAVNQTYWEVTKIQYAVRTLAGSYPALADYTEGGTITITPGTHLKINIKVTAVVRNSNFPDITQTDEDEIDFVWIRPPVVTLTSVTHSYTPTSKSIVNFSVDPRGGTVSGVLMVAIPADDTETITTVSTIVFTQTPTSTVALEGALSQTLPYNVFSNLMNDKDEVAILICASNEAGIGKFEQNLCPV